MADVISEAAMEDTQWIPLLVWTLVLGVPLFFVLKRTGKSRWWLLLAILPIVGGTVLLWIVAFSKWPAVQTQDARGGRPQRLPSETLDWPGGLRPPKRSDFD